MIDTLSIAGLRGFGTEQTITFAKPDCQNEGSGLTFIVGANNTGKTTITEAIRAFNCDNTSQPPTFSEDKRNKKYGDGRVLLKLTDEEHHVYTIKTVEYGGSMTELSASEGARWHSQQVFVLNSRRSMQYEFPRYEQDKFNYLNNEAANQASRNPYLQEFGARLVSMNRTENRKVVDPMLREVLGTDLEWRIEENINRNCYLKIKTNGVEHISEGMGDGIWSVFTICNALYDLQQNQTLVIDEPELSLHPAYQKRVMQLLKRESKNKQIIICTHSPYFIDADSLINGAFLLRTHKTGTGDIVVYALTDPKSSIEGLLKDLNQPHTFGVEAKEIFFLEDNIIVTEGQEDVVMYNHAINEIKISLNGEFFGWGAGGASKIPIILKMLHELGYEKVSAIFDGDKKAEMEQMKCLYPEYKMLIISKEDVRDKRETIAKPAKEGLLYSNGKMKDESVAEIITLFSEINSYFLTRNSETPIIYAEKKEEDDKNISQCAHKIVIEWDNENAPVIHADSPDIRIELLEKDDDDQL